MEFAEPVILCSKDGKYICLYSKAYGFSFAVPRNLNKQKQWQHQALTYCVTQRHTDGGDPATLLYSVKVQKNENCKEYKDIVGSFIYSREFGVRLLSYKNRSIYALSTPGYGQL